MMSDGLARAVLDALPDATAVVDPDGTIVAVNRAWLMFAMDNGGQPETTGVGVNYFDLCARSAAAGCPDAERAADGLRAVLGGYTVHSEVEYPCPSPAVNRWFLLRITPLEGDVTGAVMSHVNITRRKMAEQTLAHEAAHDPLTGLANRGLFADRLTAALTGRRSQVTGTQVGLMFLDADGFKQINDTYGHEAGDEALLTIGHRLRSHVRPQDTVGPAGRGRVRGHRPADQRRRAGRAVRAGQVRAEPAASHPWAPGPGSGQHRHSSRRGWRVRGRGAARGRPGHVRGQTAHPVAC